MSEAVKSLEPKSLWSHFADINAIPRASKKEERIISFMMEFGQGLGLDTIKDHIGNVIIRKPATDGFENRQTVVLQSHLDMVHQKNNETVFDFATEGIRMLVDEDWVKAEGTTLGADNGIGVAAIMALLSSTDIPHPPLEALFTIDEETGMTGALELKGGILTGDIMLNLDTEEDNELTIGCAGGIDISVASSYSQETPANKNAYSITLKGCTGGHSGMDIHLGRANANKLMNRLLQTLNKKIGLSISSIDGGGLRNAIPRESKSILCIAESDVAEFNSIIEECRNTFKTEYAFTDPNLDVQVSHIDLPSSVMDKNTQDNLLLAIYSCPNGIYRMTPEIEGLVQTSNNLARVLVENGKIEILCLTRSSVETEKHDLVNAISACFELMNANVSTDGAYPGWRPNPSSDIVKIMADLYREMFEGEPHVNACHAGLECGILGQNYPEMDMISFGPNIRGAHSPDERVQISSVQKFWKYLLETLNRIPQKAV